MKLVLATSFSSKVDHDSGHVLPEFRREIEEILTALRKNGGIDIYCAIEAEDWIISQEPPEVGVEKDLQEVDKADVILSLVHDKPSWGTQYEMGYAEAKDKQVIIATPKGFSLPYFYKGLVNLGRVKHIAYEDAAGLTQQVNKILDV